MNSLEFINQEIKFLEDMINMDLALIEDEEDLKEIAKKQERLKNLQQIKAELEAWEVVKRYTDTSEDTINTEYYFIKGMDSEFEILEKALEVKEKEPRDLELEVYEEMCVGCSDEKICHEECEHCVQFHERLEEKESEE